ncbi:MAG: ubiquinol-cytochrome C chaperone family protein [Aliidongia sp.]
MRLFGRPRELPAAHAAYAALVAQARSPVFFARHGVPDTLDGRFEMIALHAFLVLHRLRALPEAQRFGQALYDVMFADMDRALREMGTGDLSVGKQVKLMATALAGRIAAYQAGLAGEADLAEALRRNLYGTVAEPAQQDLDILAAYVRRQAAALAARPVEEVAAGILNFAPLPLDSAAAPPEV